MNNNDHTNNTHLYSNNRTMMMAADQEEGVVEACFIARSAPMGFADAPFDALMLACKIDFLRRITMVCHCPKKSCRYFVIQRDVV